MKKYIEPRITNRLKADAAIQGVPKIGMPLDGDNERTPNAPGYRADE